MTLTAQEITAKLTEQYKDVKVGIEFITPEQASRSILFKFSVICWDMETRLTDWSPF